MEKFEIRKGDCELTIEFSSSFVILDRVVQKTLDFCGKHNDNVDEFGIKVVLYEGFG